jgi:hypothetical protein
MVWHGMHVQVVERENFEAELKTEELRREKLEELIDRMHHFQNEEIETSNAMKLEEQARREQQVRVECARAVHTT